jgi:hypothetical protein
MRPFSTILKSNRHGPAVSKRPKLSAGSTGARRRKSILHEPALLLTFCVLLTAGISSFQLAPLQAGRKTQPPASPNLILHFRATVHGQPLQLHKNYTNPFGETFKTDIFRFYVGKIGAALNNIPSARNFPAGDYHLIDFADSPSTTVGLRVPQGIYNEIHFLLGVDSADQAGGAQSGALDPLKGMFWTWNTGYLSFKLEGISPESKEPFHAFSYHIGGYRRPNSTIWKIKLGMDTDGEFRIEEGQATNLVIPIELDYFFDGPTPIHIRDNAACTTPGETARMISENFTGAFTGIEIPGHP